MPKLLWVALPLLVAATLLALQAVLRRRAPSRQALNIWSSLLLVAYVATTAGLGIFWVANQQLPAFDWHYLFGYTTVLLVALHLAFNFRVAWRYLTRPPGAAPVAPATMPGESQNAAQGRRRWLGTLGVLLATGTAFVLGLRHGRSELRVQWPAPGSDAGAAASPDLFAQALELVERYHAFSTHTRTGVLLRAPGVDWGDPPPPFKRYPAAPRIALPAAAAGARPFDLQALAAVLWHTAGVTDARGPVKLRASPSSGALFSTELYVAARTVAGLPPGLWHYDAMAHALEQLAEAALADAALGAPAELALDDAAAVIVATAVFRRTGHKYRDRSYRYVLADLGHVLENLRLAAGACGAHADFIDRFDESRAAATLAIDEGEEGVLALVALRPAAAPGPAVVEPAPSALASTRPTAPATRWLLPPVPAGQALPLGVTSAVHLATSLRAAAPAPSAA
ncbi:MAG: SagB family peptide dehydrogenase, partial [Rubrivivax sp.]|nr:SagB family peptide dehydrogenase [Rubrivivax sp.]